MNPIKINFKTSWQQEIAVSVLQEIFGSVTFGSDQKSSVYQFPKLTPTCCFIHITVSNFHSTTNKALQNYRAGVTEVVQGLKKARQA